jgi:sugar phosphate isomerase/epimerase
MTEPAAPNVQLGTVAPIGFDDFADPAWIEGMKTLGCTTVQTYRNRHGNDSQHTGPVSTQQMLDAIDRIGLPCDSIHGLYGNDLDPSCPDEATRRAAMDVFRGEAELATTLGGPLVVVHCSGTHPEPLSPDDRQLRIDQLRRSAEDLAELGQAMQVGFALENLPPYHPVGNDPAWIATLCRQIDSPFLGVCFDVAHAFLAGHQPDSVIPVAEQACYLHVCDNHGQKDEHLMPFAGSIDFELFARSLREIHFGGIAMLETFYPVDRLKKLIDEGYGEKLRDWLDAINQPREG